MQYQKQKYSVDHRELAPTDLECSALAGDRGSPTLYHLPPGSEVKRGDKQRAVTVLLLYY